MPRSAKLKDKDGGAVRPDLTKTGANSDGAKLRGFLDRVASVQSTIDTIMEKAKLKCGPLREDIAEIKKESNEAGFSAKEFNTLVRKERLEKKIEKIAENLDEEQKERFEDMLAALGALSELPLGKAALAKHPEAPGARPN